MTLRTNNVAKSYCFRKFAAIRFVLLTSVSFCAALSIVPQQAAKEESRIRNLNAYHQLPKPAVSRRNVNIKPYVLPIDQKKASVFSSAFEIAPESWFENQAQAVGNNAACTDGKIVLSTGQIISPHSNPKGLVGQAIASSLGGVTPKAPAAGSTTRAAFINPPSSKITLLTDHALIKDLDETLLDVRLVISFEDPLPGTTKPSWWNKMPGSLPAGARVPALISKSSDCGKTWRRVSVIDPLYFNRGRYAVPRPVDSGTNAACPNGCYGGGDRVEAYVDPWTGYYYVSTRMTGGPLDYVNRITAASGCDPGASAQYCVDTAFIYRSVDSGRSWQQILNMPVAQPVVDDINSKRSFLRFWRSWQHAYTLVHAP